jgi:hypothetical protein
MNRRLGFARSALFHLRCCRRFKRLVCSGRGSSQIRLSSETKSALEAGLASGDVILTMLARRRQPATPPSITTPDALCLKIEPVADCGRYDSIRKIA